MKIGRLLAAGVLAGILSGGLAQAKLPVAPMDDAAKAQAAEKKAKAAAAAEQAKAQLAKAQDRAVANYEKNRGTSGKPAAKTRK